MRRIGIFPGVSLLMDDVYGPQQERVWGFGKAAEPAVQQGSRRSDLMRKLVTSADDRYSTEENPPFRVVRHRKPVQDSTKAPT
jgi:hypothetical protein